MAAQVEIEDVALTRTKTEEIPCPSETKDNANSAAANAADMTTTMKKRRPRSSKELQCEDHCIALIALSVVGLVLLLIATPRTPYNPERWYEKSVPIEALRCIRIHYDPIKGEYECINWDIKSIPLVGARRIAPSSVDGYDANKIELYAYGSTAEFAVYTQDEFKRVTVVVQSGTKNGQSITRYEVIATGQMYDFGMRQLDGALTDRLIATTVVKNANRVEKGVVAGVDWMQQLIGVMLNNFPLTDFSMGCELRVLELGEFAFTRPHVQSTNNLLYVGKHLEKAVNISPEVYQTLIDLSNSGNRLVEELYMLSGMPIKATITALSSSAFKLTVQLPAAKYCSRMNKYN